MQLFPYVTNSVLHSQKPSKSTLELLVMKRAIYFAVCTYHTDSVSNGFCRKVASEFGTNHATVSMGPGYFPPDHSGFVWFAPGCNCVVFCFIHVSTSLAQVEFRFISGINTFNFEKSCVLSLVPETSLIASKNGLAPQPSRHVCLLEVLFPAGLKTNKISS